MPNLADLIREEREGVKVPIQPVQPTKDEVRNGWTQKTLTEYLAEREAAQSVTVDVNSLHRRVARRSNVQNHKYSPLRWR